MSANYGSLILVVLKQAHARFGRPAPDELPDVARWVKEKVELVKQGYGEALDEERPVVTTRGFNG